MRGNGIRSERFDLDCLEGRTLLSAVSWTGAAGDNLWGTPLNWSGGTVPGAGDDVTVDVASSPTIRFTAAAGTQSVNSLVLREQLSLEGGVLQTPSVTIDGAVALTLKGGTLQGASLGYVGGGTLAFSSFDSTLKDVAVNGDLRLDATNERVTLMGSTTFVAARLQASGTILKLADGYVLASLISAEGTATGSRTVQVQGNPSLVTFAAAGTVSVAANSGSALTLSIGAGATVRCYGRLESLSPTKALLVSGAGTLNLSGIVDATVGQVFLSSAVVTGDASAQVLAGPGRTVRLGTTSGTLGCLGAIGIDNGRIEITGATNASTFKPTWSRVGGDVALVGVFDIDSASGLLLDDTTGSWTIQGGTLQNSKVKVQGSAKLIASASGGTLTNLTYVGDLLLADTNAAIQVGSLSGANIRLSGSGAKLTLLPGTVLDSDIAVEGSATGERRIIGTVDPEGVVAGLGFHRTIRMMPDSGGDLVIQSVSTGLSISSDIVCDAPGRTFSVESGSVYVFGNIAVHAGTLRFNGSFLSMTPGSAFTIGAAGALVLDSAVWGMNPSGPIVINGGSLTYGGSFSSGSAAFGAITNTGGFLRLTGVCDNTGRTITFNGGTGSCLLDGGTIKNGIINLFGGATLTANGTLDGTIVMSDLYVTGAATLKGSTSFSTLRMTSPQAMLTLAAGYSLGGIVESVGDGGLTGANRIVVGSTASDTAEIAQGGVIRAAAGASGEIQIVGGSLVNQGLIAGRDSGAVLKIATAAFSNQGVIDAASSTLKLNAAAYGNLSGGVLSGGVWKAGPGGKLVGGPVGITSLAANVIQIGPAAVWDALAGLQQIAMMTTYTLTGSVPQVITPATGIFTNAGGITLGPGASLVVNGVYAQVSSGSLVSQVSGLSPAAGAIVAQSATLAGVLIMEAVGGYSPSRGDLHQVIQTTAGATGAFAGVSLPQAANPELKTVAVVGASGVQVLTTSVADINNDGQLDLEDFFAFLNGFDSTGESGDINSDGQVDLADFFLFLNLFDQG